MGRQDFLKEMRMRNIARVVPVAVLALVVLTNSAQAMGKGQTKIDFKATAGDSGASSRLFAKLDVKQAVDSLPEVGSGSKNDNLAGATVTVTIGSATFSGTADEKGKVATPFDAKITGNGKGMQIKAGGLNLEQLFPLDITDGKDKSVTVALKVTASFTNATTGAVTETVLSEQNVTFKYSVKKGAIKGKNF